MAGKFPSGSRNLNRSLSGLLLRCSVASAGLVFAAAVSSPAARAQTLPTDAQIVSGHAAFANDGVNLKVHQSTPAAIISWESFSIGQPNSVHVDNGSGATLNRVRGNVASQIDGSLTATGSLYLVNPAGIAVGSTGRVQTGGSFVGSTLDIADQEFQKAARGEAYTLKGDSNATVRNAGRIGALGGDVALIGRTVENTGYIDAPNGTAALAAGTEVLVQDRALDGGRFVVKAGGKDTSVRNSGNINAAEVELRANGGNVYALAGNRNGVIAATGTAKRGGRVFLTAGDAGTVEVTQRVSARAPGSATRARNGGEIRVSGRNVKVAATLDARGRAPSVLPPARPSMLDGDGGVVIVTGEAVTLTETARVDVSGAKGGIALVGGDFQGGKDAANNYVAEKVATAKTLSVAAGATVSADGAGDAGRIVLWSDDRTDFAGHVSAVSATGRGGDAEVSGKAVLAFTGTADLLGPQGAGTLLLDPYDLEIVAGSGGDFTSSGSVSTLGVTKLTDALATANVTVQTGDGGIEAGDITVSAAVNWDAPTMLTLVAHRDVVVKAAITADNAQGKLKLRADSAGTGTGIVIFDTADTMRAPGGIEILYNAASYEAPSDFTANIESGNPLTAYMLVNTIEKLQSIGAVKATHAYNYALGRDIDASVTSTWNAGRGFKPIGTALYGGIGPVAFTGIFDGQNHTISGLFMDRRNEHDIGLFGYANGATIRNVGLVGSSVKGTATGMIVRAGGLLGYGINNNTLTNVYVIGSVLATANGHQAYAGGLVGHAGGGTSITNAYMSGTVTASSNGSSASNGAWSGGLVGYSSKITIADAYSTAAIAASSSDTKGNFVGGLAGYVSYGSHISRAYATGAVSATGGPNNYIGGLVGQVLSQDFGSNLVNVETSFWDKTTTGQATAIGATSGVGNWSSVANNGLTTAQLQDTTGFAQRTTNWNFDSVWAPPSAGHYPELYALSKVIRVDTRSFSTYGSDQLTVPETLYYGGPQGWAERDRSAGAAYYIFGPADQSPGTPGVGGIDTSGYTGKDGTNQWHNAGTAIGLSSSAGGGEVTQNGYRFVYTGGITVRPHQLTVTTEGDAFNWDKTYDGASTASSKTVTIAGIPSESLNLVLKNITYADKNAGSNIGVTGVWELANNGAFLASNYILANAGYNSTGFIGQRAVTLKATANRIYDGTAWNGMVDAPYTVENGSFVGTDKTALGTPTAGGWTLTRSGNPAALADVKNAGTYRIIGADFTDADVAANYAITWAADSVVTIGQRAVTLKATAGKTYDGDAWTWGSTDTIAAIGGTSFAPGDSADTLGATTWTLESGGIGVAHATNAGDYLITGATFASGGNYAITWDPTSTLTIGKRAVTLKATAGKTYDGNAWTWGGSDSVITTGGTSFVAGDSVDTLGAATWTLENGGIGVALATNAGDYLITGATFASGGNYAITMDPTSTLTIGQRAVTLKATAGKTYDGNAWTWGGSDSVITTGGTSFVAGDSVNTLGAATWTLENGGIGVAQATNAGDYLITSATFANGGNYAITMDPTSTLTIGQRAITLKATAGKTYDGDAWTWGGADSVITTGGTSFVTGDSIDTLGAATWTFENGGVGVAQATNAGDYLITGATFANGGNYAITWDPTSTLTIGQRAITLKATAGKTYDGNAWTWGSTDTLETVGRASFAPGESADTLGAATWTLENGGVGVAQATNAGDYLITGATFANGGNYAITWDPASTLTIGQRAITLKATANRTYNGRAWNGTVDSYSVVRGSFANTDENILGVPAAGGWQLSRGGNPIALTDARNAGQYLITGGTFADAAMAANYAITWAADSIVTIGKAQLTINPAAGQRKTIGDSGFQIGFQVQGWQPGDDKTALLRGALGHLGTTAGTWAITLGTLSVGDNYSLQLAAGATLQLVAQSVPAPDPEPDPTPLPEPEPKPQPNPGPTTPSNPGKGENPTPVPPTSPRSDSPSVPERPGIARDDIDDRGANVPEAVSLVERMRRLLGSQAVILDGGTETASARQQRVTSPLGSNSEEAALNRAGAEITAEAAGAVGDNLPPYARQACDISAITEGGGAQQPGGRKLASEDEHRSYVPIKLRLTLPCR